MCRLSFLPPSHVLNGTPDLNPMQLIVTEFSVTAPEQSLVLETKMFVLIVLLR